MRIKACLRPGQNGTKKWSITYGDRLVSARYRYDENKKRRYTTVEIIVEEGDWNSGESHDLPPRTVTDRLAIRVEGYEIALRKRVKEAGGIWRPRQQLWELPCSKIVELGLKDTLFADVEICFYM